MQSPKGTFEELLKINDIVIHGAGLTDVVPKTKIPDDYHINTQIHKIGTWGSREIIKNLSKDQKLIFYSTHVIFENISPGVLNINENSEPAPLLAYSTSKRQTELDLLDSNLNFTVLRLASVYGFNNCVRHRILPNWFSYLAGQGKDLSCFGAGTNVKPLVCCNDVARAAQFVLENRNQICSDIAAECWTGTICEACMSKFTSLLQTESRGGGSQFPPGSIINWETILLVGGGVLLLVALSKKKRGRKRK